MRIVLLCSKDHVFANYLVRHLVGKYKDMIVGIFESEGLSGNKSFFQTLRLYFRKSGFCFLFFQGIRQLIFKVGKTTSRFLRSGNKKSPFYHWRRLLGTSSATIYRTVDINSDDDIQKLSNLSADLIISIFFPQVLKSRVLESVRFGCLNMHPSLLPAYKGLHPVFWALACSESYIGMSVHLMQLKVDCGQILLQKKIEVLERDTEHSLYVKSCVIGAELLTQIVDRLQKSGSFPDAVISNTDGNYYSIPDRRAIRAFCNAGRKFFHLRELFYEFEHFIKQG